MCTALWEEARCVEIFNDWIQNLLISRKKIWVDRMYRRSVWRKLQAEVLSLQETTDTIEGSRSSNCRSVENPTSQLGTNNEAIRRIAKI